MSHNELKSKLQEYKSLKEMLNELKDTLTAIEDDIKAIMGEQEELSVDGIKVKYTHYTAKRFDSPTFKKEHQAMYEQYIKATEARRFQIA